MSSLFTLREPRHRTGLVVCALFASLLTSIAHAQQDTWGGSLAVTSDYRVRGISKTWGEAAVQGGLHAQTPSGWIVGAWGSTVSRNRGRSSTLEVDAYAGYGRSFSNDWDLKAIVTHYWYPNDPAETSYDYDELSVTLGFRSQLFATVAWSPNSKYFSRYQGSWHAEEGASVSYELTGLQPIATGLSLTAGVGYNDLTNVVEAGYWYWNAGLSYSVGPVQLDVSRIDSDTTAEDLFGSIVTEAGWSAAISWRF